VMSGLMNVADVVATHARLIPDKPRRGTRAGP
jgi:hypothetical protein